MDKKDSEATQRWKLAWSSVLMCHRSPTSRKPIPRSLSPAESSLFSSKPWGRAVIWGASQEWLTSPPFHGSLSLVRGKTLTWGEPRPPGAWEVRGAGDFHRRCLKLWTSEDLLSLPVTRHCSPLTKRCLAPRTCLYETIPFLFRFSHLIHSVNVLRDESNASSIFKKSNQALSQRHEQVAIHCALPLQFPQLQTEPVCGKILSSELLLAVIP